METVETSTDMPEDCERDSLVVISGHGLFVDVGDTMHEGNILYSTGYENR